MAGKVSLKFDNFKDDQMDHDLHTALVELNFKELKIKEMDAMASILKLWAGTILFEIFYVNI
jgi:hypothetical protein